MYAQDSAQRVGMGASLGALLSAGIMLVAALSMIPAPPVQALPPAAVPTGCRDLITNGSFETGNFTGWTTAGSPWIATYMGHASASSGVVGGGNNRADAFQQQVTIPANATSATLALWWYIYSQESSASAPVDLFYVELLDAAGTLLATPLTLSNASTRQAWLQAEVALTLDPDLRGQTIWVRFLGTTDGQYFTSFYVDDVVVDVCSPETPTVTPTPSQTPTPTATSACADPFEPNESFEEAILIGAGAVYHPIICNSDDLDYFKFSVVAGQQIRARVYGLSYNADLRLYDPETQEVGASSNPGTEDELVIHDAAYSAQYYVQVFGTEGEAENPYALRVDLVAPPTATPTPTPTHTPTPTPPTCPDGFEPNDTLGGPAWDIHNAAYASYICTAQDVDYWKIGQVSADHTIKVRLSDLPQDYDLDLYRPAPDLGLAARSNQAGQAAEVIAFTADTAGDWYARVTGQGVHFDPVHPYTIFAETCACRRDIWEPNEEAALAPVLSGLYSGSTLPDLSLCPTGDQDWYYFAMMAGERVVTSITHDPAQGPLRLCLVDVDRQTELACTHYDIGLNQIDYFAPATGHYYLSVVSAAPGGGAPAWNPAYSLAARVYPLTPTPTATATATETRTATPTATGTPTRTATPPSQQIVQVRDEGGILRAGARIYRNGYYVGSTGADGTLAVADLRAGDTLAAQVLVGWQQAAKMNHARGDAGEQNWAWHVYQTSVPIADDGAPQLHIVTNPNVIQTLSVRRDRPLIGMHVVVSVEWDADQAYLADLRLGLERASTYLYDVTDGQALFELIEVFDRGDSWADADIQVHASNTVWPSANVWGITRGRAEHIYLGRRFDGASANQGPWANTNGFRTMIHEFGHYGLGLWDEYLDRAGKRTAEAFCATNRSSVVEEQRASIMDHQFDATELCSDFDPNHRHRTETWHDFKSGGESTWETVLRRFADEDTPAAWTLRSPVERKAVMPGPNAIPVIGWSQVFITDHQDWACRPFTAQLINVLGFPVAGLDVWVARGGAYPDLAQGRTDANGEIELLGAHDGDTLWASLKVGLIRLAASQRISCPSRLAAESVFVLGPDPFDLDIAVAPLAADVLQITAEVTATLAGAPRAAIWQAGAAEPTTLALAYDAGPGRYRGQATLDATLARAGYVQVVVTDTVGQPVQARGRFDCAPVPAGEITRLQSADSNFELVLPADSLAADAVIAIQSSSAGSQGQADLARISPAYQVTASTGQQALNAPATVHMRYHADQLAGIRPHSLRIFRWDEAAQAWLPQSSLISPLLHMVSANVSQLGVFAILGQRGSELYLPLVLK